MTFTRLIRYDCMDGRGACSGSKGTGIPFEIEYMKYRSKKDPWVLVLVWIAILFPLTFGFCAVHIESEPLLVGSGWVSLAVGSLFALSLALLSFPLYYEITSSTLRIRCGLLLQEIPFSSIQAILPTRNPLPAPAWSLDRLQVNYGVGEKPFCALIAPHDKEDFLCKLAECDSELEVKAGSVLRRQ
jgi:Bacterial PH domain